MEALTAVTSEALEGVQKWDRDDKVQLIWGVSLVLAGFLSFVWLMLNGGIPSTAPQQPTGPPAPTVFYEADGTPCGRKAASRKALAQRKEKSN